MLDQQFPMGDRKRCPNGYHKKMVKRVPTCVSVLGKKEEKEKEQKEKEEKEKEQKEKEQKEKEQKEKEEKEKEPKPKEPAQKKIKRINRQMYFCRVARAFDAPKKHDVSENNAGRMSHLNKNRSNLLLQNLLNKLNQLFLRCPMSPRCRQ